MIAFLGALLGFLGSVLPSVVAYFNKRTDNALTLELARINASAQANSLDLERLKAAIAEGQSLREHDSSLDGGIFFNALRASIRPILTYSFFALFMVVKTAAAYLMIVQGYSIPDMLQAVWDADTAGLFACVFMFWFGTLAWSKIGSK